ncbi:hypothetical protein C8D04_2000 [Simplicispira sp. 125]|nr:hypothetical protein C8D04_2000 [Simplicispira sp. 125]REG17680.1 hypothetical protein C8D01_2310 [Simplicispira sp. 110]
MIRGMMFAVGALVPGQQAWTTAGTYSFTVPDNCTEIASVGIGSGGSGATGSSGDSNTSGGGGGGALTYHNAIAVTPGETLTVVIGVPGYAVVFTNGDGVAGAACTIKRGATTLLEARGGSGGSNTGTGGPGGVATTPSGGVSYAGGLGGGASSGFFTSGGSSGRYAAAGVTGGPAASGIPPANGADLFGNSTGSTVGHGGAGVKGPNSSAGVVGGVRIMWGPGRSFPSNAADV